VSDALTKAAVTALAAPKEVPERLLALYRAPLDRPLEDSDFRKMMIPGPLRADIALAPEHALIVENYIANVHKRATDGTGLLLFGEGPVEAIAVEILKRARQYRDYQAPKENVERYLQRYTCLYVGIPTLKEAYRTRGWSDDPATLSFKAKHANFLVLAGLEARQFEDKLFTRADLEDFVSVRFQAERPTIIATHLTLKELAVSSLLDPISSGLNPMEVKP
jgi:hypothetical protein